MNHILPTKQIMDDETFDPMKVDVRIKAFRSMRIICRELVCFCSTKK
jgi:hypothetical protein